MISKENEVALIVHTCDRYAFLYEGFDIFFSKYWDNSIKCKCYFITEEKPVNIPGFTNILSRRGEWSDRLALVLRQEITEKYILYFQEDMWLSKPVNPAFFNHLFEIAERNNWLQVKLHSSEIYKPIPTDLFIQGFRVATIDNNSGYQMSH
ncbi:MAG: hypothetical protein ABIP80_06145, partial [Ferruginibacter sp.]